MKLLLHPNTERPLWDAGRVVPPGAREHFELRGLDSERPVRLVVRAAPTADFGFRVVIDGRPAGNLTFVQGDRWVEAELDSLRVESDEIQVELEPSSTERVQYHVFAVQ
jgi:hypothetical protein